MRVLILILAVLAGTAGVAAAERLPIRAEVVRVIDGDTIEVRVDAWIGVEISARVRLRGIDTPEIHGKCEIERTAAEAARARLAQLVGGTVVLEDVGGDKYFGRYDARVLTAAGVDVAAVLLAEGKGRPYDGGKRRPWCP